MKNPYLSLIATVMSLLQFISMLSLAGNKDCHSSIHETGAAAAHNHGDLFSYIQAMEKSSLQKAAVGSLGRPGVLADLGTGHGASAHDLALLFPGSKVIGLDLDPQMIAYAKETYQSPNLEYRVGNAQISNFRANSLQTIFISSVLHHLTSFGEGEFDVRHVEKAFDAAHKQLKVGGVLIVRDFLIPQGPETVWLELPDDDGRDHGPVRELSTSKLFEQFAIDFRSSVHPHSGVDYQRVSGAPLGRQRFQVSLRDATEFLLRKDYQADYDSEIREEYTFLDQKGFEGLLRERGFRLLHSAPIYNPWIIENRYRSKVRILDLNGRELSFPPTNYVVAAEKVGEGQGVRLTSLDLRNQDKPGFLSRFAMADKKSKAVFDVVARPGMAIDILPFFKKRGSIYVLAKQGFPRPITTTLNDSSLVEDDLSGYVIEPLSFILNSSYSTYSQIEDQLFERAGLRPEQVLRSGPITFPAIYVSPGLANERAQAIALPLHPQKMKLSAPPQPYTRLTSTGVIRPLEATQILRASQVGAILDARLEMAVYQLLLKMGGDFGPWIGEDITLRPQSLPVRLEKVEQLFEGLNRKRMFERVSDQSFGDFLEVKFGRFGEFNSSDKLLSIQGLEFVQPRHYSANVVSVLPVMRSERDGDFYVGLEHRHLPVIQLEEGTSDHFTIPAWRIPKDKVDLSGALSFVTNHLASDFKLRSKKFFTLGGYYHPSKGLTPEIIYPYLVNVEPRQKGSTGLHWVALRELLKNLDLVKDAHLKISVLRASHAFGVINKNPSF